MSGFPSHWETHTKSRVLRAVASALIQFSIRPLRVYC
jgi:hypothetical protein